MKGPVNKRYYNSCEIPHRYPLELTDQLHICLWSDDGKYKWSIAYWLKDEEGYELHFVGDRPLDERVSWRDLEAIIRQGQAVADSRWKQEQANEG